MFGLMFLVVIGSSVAVGFDAAHIGAHKVAARGIESTTPVAWAGGCLLFWIIFFPLYLVKRSALVAVADAGGTETAGGKECPRCAEMVKDRAQVCRFCGYEFG